MKNAASFILITVLSLGFISCQKDDLKEALQNNDNARITTRFAGRDTLQCGNHDVFEYDILAMLVNYEYLSVDTILRSYFQDSIYSLVSNQISLANSIGFEAWYFQFFGQEASADVVDELDNIFQFAENNFDGPYYASLIDSLVEGYVSDNRFNHKEKNYLTKVALTSSTVWQLVNCKEKGIELRGEEDNMLCTPLLEDVACAYLQAFVGFSVGYAVGWTFSQSHILYQQQHDLVTALLGLFGIYASILLDPADCVTESICDDCHHPVDITLQYDYFACRYTRFQWFGAFEFAEGWVYNVTSNSGNDNGQSFVPRAAFPSNFNPNGVPFSINVITYCDGSVFGNPVFPENNPNGFTKIFPGTIPKTPMSVMGPIVVNSVQEFVYTSSTPFNGNISNPFWSVSEGVEILDEGVLNGLFFIKVNFENVTTPQAIIVLRALDNCSNSYIEKRLTVSIGPCNFC